MKRFHTTTILSTMIAASFVAAPALANGNGDHDHDHNGDDHPDIDIHLHDGHIDLHTVYSHHHNFEFEQTLAGDWQTRHGGDTWPGFEGSLGEDYANADFSFTSHGPLYYWDGDDPDGLSPLDSASDLGLQITETGTGLDNSITVDANDTMQTLDPVVTASSSGSVHNHPEWDLVGYDNEPADGAYLVLFSLDSSHADIGASDLSGIVFHKGLSDDQYADAVDQAHHIVPEPGSLALLGLGGAFMLARRRDRARAHG